MPIAIRALAATAVGAAASLALAAPAFAQQPEAASAVDATLRCVQNLNPEDFRPADRERLKPGERYLLARFGARNNTQQSISAADIDQELSPTSSIFDQTDFPGAFAPGEYDEDVLAAVFTGDELTWSLVGEQPAIATAARASSAFEDRCLSMHDASDKTQVSGDRAHLAWHSRVSGENRDGLGLGHWEGWTDRTCVLTKGGEVLETREDCGTREDEVLKPWVTFTELKPGKYELLVSGRPPRLCPEGESRKDCIPYTAPDGASPIGDEHSVNTRTARVTFGWEVSAPSAPPTEKTPAPQQPTEQTRAPQQPAPQTPVEVVVPPINNVSPPPQIVEPPACTPRTLKIKVPAVRGKRIRSATAKVDGRRVALRKRSGRLVAVVRPTASSARKVAVKISVRYSDGTRKTLKYRLRACR